MRELRLEKTVGKKAQPLSISVLLERTTMITVTTMVVVKKMDFNGISSGSGDKSIEVATQGVKRVIHYGPK